jgi:hypothetical protein
MKSIVCGDLFEFAGRRSFLNKKNAPSPAVRAVLPEAARQFAIKGAPSESPAEAPVDVPPEAPTEAPVEVPTPTPTTVPPPDHSPDPNAVPPVKAAADSPLRQVKD